MKNSIFREGVRQDTSVTSVILKIKVLRFSIETASDIGIGQIEPCEIDGPHQRHNGGDLRIFLDDMVKVFHTGQEIQAYNLGAGQVESFSTGKHRRFGRSGIPPKSSSPAKIC